LISEQLPLLPLYHKLHGRKFIPKSKAHPVQVVENQVINQPSVEFVGIDCERNAHASSEITEKYAIVSGTLTQAMLNKAF
jgi:hypothetical protein